MVSSGIFSVIVWVFGPLLALVGAIMLVTWLLEEIRSGFYHTR